MLARHGHTRGVNDVGLNAARLEPACQPEPVTAGLEGNDNAFDPASCFLRFLPPSMQQPRNALSSTASFFNGWRSMPGTIPATSQLDRLISMTAINVLAGSRAMRDRLKLFNVCMGQLHRFTANDGCNMHAAAP